MAHVAANEYVKIPKQEYNLLKEAYRSLQRQAFLVRIGESEKNLVTGKTKSASIDDLIASI